MSYIIVKTKVCTGPKVKDYIITQDVDKALGKIKDQINQYLWSTCYKEYFVYKDDVLVETFRVFI